MFQVLYAEKNRIRTIKNSSLSQYTSLRFLYLGNNFISKIEPGAFSELDELEVVIFIFICLYVVRPDDYRF